MKELKVLCDEIEQLKEQHLVCQESFFSDDEEIEAIEESIKEKVGQFGNKVREKFYNAVVNRMKNPEKIQKEVDKVEKLNEEINRELEKREVDGEKALEKVRRCVWYGLLGNLDPLFGPGIKPTKKLRNAIKFNNMWMTALNKRQAELQGGEEAPAQESADIELKALLYDITVLKEQLSVCQESFFPDDEEIEALEESIKEKAGELETKVYSKVYGAISDVFKKPDGRINKAIAKAEKQIGKLESILNKRDEERDFATVMRIVKQSACALFAPKVFAALIVLSKNVQPSLLLRRTLKLEKILLSKLNQRKEELEAKNEEPAQESAGLEFELEFLDDEE